MARFVAESIAGMQEVRRAAPRAVALAQSPDAGPLRALLSESLGVVRERTGLSAAISRVQPLAFLGGASADPALVALMIAAGALAREESRGGHWRSDFRQTSPAWRRRLVQRIDDTGTEIVCRAVPLSTALPSVAAGA